MRSLLPVTNQPPQRKWLGDLNGPIVPVSYSPPEVRERMKQLELNQLPTPNLKICSDGTLFVFGPEGEENFINWCALQLLRYSTVVVETVKLTNTTRAQNLTAYRLVSAKLAQARAEVAPEEEEEEPEEDDWQDEPIEEPEPQEEEP